MREFEKIIDPVFVKPASYNRLDRFWLSLLSDERDLPLLHLCLRLFLIVIPFAALLYLPIPRLWWWLLAVAYTLVNNLIFKGPYILMLHCTSHRPFFKKQYDYLNKLVHWVLGPFFGQTPETYYSHHLGMHHAENNLEEDLSSTMMYQRDSLAGFMRYFLDFFFAGIVQLTRYFTRRNRKKMAKNTLAGEISYFVVMIGLLWVNAPATLVVFIASLVLSRFLMMAGNWSQHSFVDYNEPGNAYKNSTNCINTPYNRKCWNDGYHINHHLKPTMHWTQYPIHFQENIHLFAKNKALVFDGIDSCGIWCLLMTRNYKKLASHLVNIDNTFASDEEAIALMKARTRKMPLRGINARNYKAMMSQLSVNG